MANYETINSNYEDALERLDILAVEFGFSS